MREILRLESARNVSLFKILYPTDTKREQSQNEEPKIVERNGCWFQVFPRFLFCGDGQWQFVHGHRSIKRSHSGGLDLDDGPISSRGKAEKSSQSGSRRNLKQPVTSPSWSCVYQEANHLRNLKNCGTMMACGVYDLDSLFCRPSLPPPDVQVDKSNFDDLPTEERLAITQRELQMMKETLRIKESDFEDSQHELKFHAIKNEELMDVINAFRSSSPDRAHELMRAKAEQNSELTVQVHSLRDLLTKSGEQIAVLQKELKLKTNEADNLASQQRTLQRLQVQLKGIVKTLNNVDVSTVDIPSEWINLQWITESFNKNTNNEDSDETVRVITRKIIAMEADRKRLLKESRLTNQSDDEKKDEIFALGRKIRKMQHDQDELKETNKSLKEQLAVREGKIGALEELFQSINANRKIEADKAEIPNRRNSLLNIDDDDDEDDCESIDIDSLGAFDEGAVLSFEDMFTNIWTSFTGAAPDEVKRSTNEENQDIASCFNDSYHTKQVEEELQTAAKVEYDELRESHQALTKDHEVARYDISVLASKLEESTIKANSFATKAELREKLLKDVIDQYKELQIENAETKDRMAQLKQKTAALLQLEKDRHEERKAKEVAFAAAAAETGKIVVKSPAVTALGETPTFDMSERTRLTSDDDSSEDDGVVNDGLDKKFLMEDYERMQGESDRLQHEFDSAIEKINDLTESLQESKDQMQKFQSVQANQARTIALLEGEKMTLQDRIIEVTKKVDTQSMHNRTEDELKQAELREKEAREKQVQREKELWDVIEQYKKLADENQATKQQKEEVELEKAEVEHELMLTQKVKIQRHDLVYEYRKLENGKKPITRDSISYSIVFYSFP